jgi:hypothetical protein
MYRPQQSFVRELALAAVWKVFVGPVYVLFSVPNRRVLAPKQDLIRRKPRIPIRIPVNRCAQAALAPGLDRFCVTQSDIQRYAPYGLSVSVPVS